MNRPKTILITGCSSGIGACVATGLRARGYRVFATARKPSDVVTLREQGFESEVLDLTDSNTIRTAVENILATTGGTLDYLFNNGGYGQPGAMEDLTRDTLRDQFETNVFGTVELTNRIVPVMRAQSHGRILINGSVLGLVAMPYRGAYNATKFALEGIADTLRQELRSAGIFVSLIEPGPITSRFRVNAHAMYKARIDAQRSAHRITYEGMERRLNKKGPAQPFTRPPEAVLRKVIHALEARRPRPRYYVTVPTYFLGTLRRMLSTRALDATLNYFSRRENR